MAPHPIQLRVAHNPQMARAQVVSRLVLLIALGTVGCSSMYWVIYLAIPAFVAIRISQTSAQRYLDHDGPRIVRALRWLAGVYAYLWLLTDALPSVDEDAVELAVNPGGAPNASTALLRLVTSLPALLVLGILSFAAGLLWPIGAVLILVRQRLPAVLFDFFQMTLRGQFRFIGYHLSLVDRYSSFEEGLTFPDASRSEMT